MKALRIVGVLAAVGAGLLAVPKDSGAHCVPGYIHMQGYSHSDYGESCNYYYDSGCVYVGTFSDPHTEGYCSNVDPYDGHCRCWSSTTYYNCDGC
jgi:hypothetical protein